MMEGSLTYNDNATRPPFGGPRGFVGLTAAAVKWPLVTVIDVTCCNMETSGEQNFQNVMIVNDDQDY
jgi:hypothetical protein